MNVFILQVFQTNDEWNECLYTTHSQDIVNIKLFIVEGIGIVESIVRDTGRFLGIF